MNIWELIKDKIWTTSDGDLEVIDVDSVKELIKEAYNQAIQDASENAEANLEIIDPWMQEQNENNCWIAGKHFEVPVIRNSILKLKIK